MPKNTAMGFVIGTLSFLFGFALIWHMFWLAILSAIGMIAGAIIHIYQKHPDNHLSAAEVAKIEARKA